MNIYLSNTYRKDLSWLHFDIELRVQEIQQVKDQQSCISIFVAYPTISSSKLKYQPEGTALFHAWLYGSFIKIQSNLRRKKLHRMNQGSNFLGGSFSNRDNVRTPIQFRREGQPQLLKDDFSSRTDPSIFTSIAPVLLDWLKEPSWVFPELKLTSYFHKYTLSHRSDLSSEANFSCCHKSDAWSHLE